MTSSASLTYDFTVFSNTTILRTIFPLHSDSIQHSHLHPSFPKWRSPRLRLTLPLQIRHTLHVRRAQRTPPIQRPRARLIRHCIHRVRRPISIRHQRHAFVLAILHIRCTALLGLVSEGDDGHGV